MKIIKYGMKLLTDLIFLKHQHVMEVKTLGFCGKRQDLPHWKSKKNLVCMEFFVGLALLSLLFFADFEFFVFPLGFLVCADFR
jgi:hypothetical protein